MNRILIFIAAIAASIAGVACIDGTTVYNVPDPGSMDPGSMDTGDGAAADDVAPESAASASDAGGDDAGDAAGSD
jgi:hypothetical protein